MREPTWREVSPAAWGVAISIVLLALAGCRPRVRPPLQVPAAIPSTEELERSLASSRAEIRSLRGFADISYRAAGEKHFFTGRHAVVVESPDRFRLEAHSPFGLLGVAACDGRTLSVYDRRSGSIYRGRASRERIGSYLSVAMSPQEVVSVLLGRVPERRWEGVLRVEFDGKRREFRLDHWSEGVRSDTIWFRVQDLAVARAEIEGPLGQRIVITMGEYGHPGGVSLPYMIEVEAQPRGGGLRLAYRDLAVNEQIPAQVFEIPAIAGAQELRLDQDFGARP